MSRFIDLTGMIFGKSKVIMLDRIDKNGSHWIVRCSCGRSEDFSVSGSNLKNRNSACCKICRKEAIIDAKLIDLTGKVFGKLSVIKQDNDSVKSNGEKRVKWICSCSCGRNDNFSANSSSLISGKTYQCNICRYELASKSKLNDITGNIFGRLRVLEFFERKNGITKWLCYCDPELGGCGSEKVISYSHLQSNNTTSCGCRTESIFATEIKNYFLNNYYCAIEYPIFKNPKTNKPLPYDIYIFGGKDPKINGVYIEIHGEQHYRFIPYWHKTIKKFEYNCWLDEIKKEYGETNGAFIEVNIELFDNYEDIISHIESILKTV